MTADIRRIDIAEFQELGFLQEANRQFLVVMSLVAAVMAIATFIDIVTS